MSEAHPYARLTPDVVLNGLDAVGLRTDGRLLAFFSTRKSGSGPGLYVLSLKRFTAQRLSSQMGEALRWAPLPK